MEKSLKSSSWPCVALVLAVAGGWGCDKHHRDEHFVTPQMPAPTVPARPPPRVEVDAAPPGAGDSAPPDAGETPAPDAAAPNGRIRDAGPADSGPGNTQDPDGTDTTELPPPPVVEEFTKRGLLEAAARCAFQSYEAFAQRAQALAEAVTQYADSPNGDRLGSARTAFIEAMREFQRLELFRLGPAARSMEPGGQDLRDLMYSFPQTNRCQVDRHLVSRTYATNFDNLLFNARGLAALEYLLFNSSLDNVCSAITDINAAGSWTELSEEELKSRRAEYAKVLAQDVRKRAEALVQAWSPGGGNFTQQFVEAGNGSQVYSSQQAALNALSHALFYVEKEVKDYKLGWPLGMVAECISGHCPDAAESPYARRSLDSIAQNLHAFRLIFEGCQEAYAGFGFDDWLRAANPDGDLDRRMLEALKSAQQSVAEFQGSLEDAFYDNPDAARHLHAAVKGVTDLLKTEFITVLNLELPMTAEGDND